MSLFTAIMTLGFCIIRVMYYGGLGVNWTSIEFSEVRMGIQITVSWNGRVSVLKVLFGIFNSFSLIISQFFSTLSIVQSLKHYFFFLFQVPSFQFNLLVFFFSSFSQFFYFLPHLHFIRIMQLLILFLLVLFVIYS